MLLTGEGLTDTHIIQSILIDKHKIKFTDALLWILKHKFKANKVDETNDYYRFRQFEPKLLKKRGFINYKTIEKTDRIKEVIAFK
jgi:hypothetical protein